MTDLNPLERPSSIADIIVNSDRRSAEPHPRPRLTRRQIVDISIVLDAVIVFLAFVLAQYAYTLSFDAELWIGANYTLVGVVTGLIHYGVARTRDGSSQQLRPSTAGSVLRSLLITFAIVVAVGYALKQAEIHSRLWLALSLAFAFTLIVAKNRILHLLIDRGLLREFVVESIALFGDASITASLKSSLKTEHGQLCRIGIYGGGSGGNATAVGDDLELRRLIADGLSSELDRIIFCLPSHQIDRIKGLVDAISFLPVRIEVCLAQSELQALKGSLLVSPGQILISLDDRPQDEWGVLLKRIMDVVLGSIVLSAVAPVMLLAAIAIKLESGGPVFFRQRRHGWNHSIISVCKFRTMTVQEDGDVIKQAVPNDPRVTRVGRFLRKTSIDELPQLFNVLSGEMSLVGPRPHALAHNVHFSEMIASYASRHKVKPGITGWAQVKGLRGNSEDIAKMVARAEADIWYIRNWSVMLDLKILALTPLAVMLQENAL